MRIAVIAIWGWWTANSFGGTYSLTNNLVRAEFDASGLKAITESVSGETVQLARDEFSLSINGQDYTNASFGTPSVETATNKLTFRYSQPGLTLDVIYELKPAWRFVSKQIVVASSPAEQYRVDRVTVFRTAFASGVSDTYIPGNYEPQFGGSPPRTSARDYGAFVRFSDETGLFFTVQNPFLSATKDGNTIAISYTPQMEWKREYGNFASDTGCIGLYRLTGRRIPARMTYEWKLPSPDRSKIDGADVAEIAAFTECVRAFLINPREEPSRVEVGWTLNDYQIDVATAAGRTEYKRVIDTTSDLGLTTLLYAPSDSNLAKRDESADDWKWEYVLWLGLGEKIRSGAWDVHTGEIPAEVSEMIQYAQAKHIKLLAYAYPSLPFAGNPAWLVPASTHTGQKTATLSSRAFQDYFLDLLIAFAKRTGIGGYSFDYAFFEYPGSSAYSQWWGWRRVLEKLREALPGIVIDGRQSYQLYGPWGWLAGTYPHPTGNDEQPESFVPFPDLHFDRVSADRQRYVAYWYRNYMFAPEEIIPGYSTHQTERSKNVEHVNPDGTKTLEPELMLTSFRTRDWDYLGWRYSLLSSIATAGWNNVVDMIPGRDVEEYEHFSAQDKAWFRKWLDWTKSNKELLKSTINILGPPAIGKADGTAAITGDHGFIFLFNPEYRANQAVFRLDQSVGLTKGDRLVLRQLEPRAGIAIGKPGAGFWSFGDEVSLSLPGTSATVLEIAPASESDRPMLFNVPGRAVLSNGSLKLEGVSGEPGTAATAIAALPRASSKLEHLVVNGQKHPFEQRDGIISADLHFAGTEFRHSQEVRLSPTNVSGEGVMSGSFTVPKRVLAQLAERNRAYPIHWTDEDKKTTWLAPGRLLLDVQIAEPSDRMSASVKIDGRPVLLTRAYSSVREHGPDFVGWYVDLSSIEPDTTHTVEVALPRDLKPGQFRGMFFDNVEQEYTQQVQ